MQMPRNKRIIQPLCTFQTWLEIATHVDAYAVSGNALKSLFTFLAPPFRQNTAGETQKIDYEQ